MDSHEELRSLLEANSTAEIELEGFLSTQGWVDLRVSGEDGIYVLEVYREGYEPIITDGGASWIASLICSLYAAGSTAYPPKPPAGYEIVETVYNYPACYYPPLTLFGAKVPHVYQARQRPVYSLMVKTVSLGWIEMPELYQSRADALRAIAADKAWVNIF